ncbi:terpenoid synthase [Pluteus cervinus]|uniref:Terpenoid synthase n=1 Tax=Pluteus cervinus TaxID=181527 RepID=A0ACD3BI76_9AGAR|nr:terpenoid synthase [Pluteus cervinus]
MRGKFRIRIPNEFPRLIHLGHAGHHQLSLRFWPIILSSTCSLSRSYAHRPPDPIYSWVNSNMPRPPSLRPLSSKILAQQSWVTRHRCRRHYSALAQKVEQTVRPISDPLPIPEDPLFLPQSKPRPKTPKTKTNLPTLRPTTTKPDPFTLLSSELSQVQGNLLNLLGAAHPGLDQVVQCYFLNPAKQIRPLLVLLFSRATNGLGSDWESKKLRADEEGERRLMEELNRPLRQAETLNEWNPSMPDHTASFQDVFELRKPPSSRGTGLRLITPEILPPSYSIHRTQPTSLVDPCILPSQLRLAHIMEMVYVSSLLHEQILDESSSSSNSGSSSSDSDAGLGNKLSILGGDFLLGRASTALSRLGSSEVVELIATVLSNLVEGEILQMHRITTPTLKGGVYPGPTSIDEAWRLYLKKTYFKTASLMAKGARAAAVLGGCREDDLWGDVAYNFSRNFGTAYQLVKDTREYDITSPSLKPGLASGPALYASEEYPELRPLIERNFSHEGDIEQVLNYVNKSSGIERTRTLAEAYADRARQTLQLLPESDTRLALEALTDQVTTRTW